MAKSYKYSRSRKPLSLKDAKLRLTDCIKQMEKAVLDDDVDPKEISMKTQAVYAMSTAINRYTRLCEVVDLQRELDELKQKVENEDYD